MTTQQLRELLARATPGPWEAEPIDPAVCSPIVRKLDPRDWERVINMPAPPFALGATGAVVAYKNGANDAALIAAAVNALPRLLDVVEAAGEVVDADVGAMHFASEESCRRFNDAINGLRAAVAKWREG